MSPVGDFSEECEGQGTFSWENEDAVPSAWETVYQVIFRPEDPDAEDYSQEEGWVEESGVVIRQVTVRCFPWRKPVKTERIRKHRETPEDGGSQGESGTGEVPDSSGEGNTGSEAGEARMPEKIPDPGQKKCRTPEQAADLRQKRRRTPEQAADLRRERRRTPEQAADLKQERRRTPEQAADLRRERRRSPEQAADPEQRETPDTGDSGNENGEFPEEGTDGDNSGNQAPDAGESGSGQEQPGTGETPGDGNQTPENGGQDETDEGDPATGGEDGSAAGRERSPRIPMCRKTDQLSTGVTERKIRCRQPDAGYRNLPRRAMRQPERQEDLPGGAAAGSRCAGTVGCSAGAGGFSG